MSENSLKKYIYFSVISGVFDVMMIRIKIKKI